MSGFALMVVCCSTILRLVAAVNSPDPRARVVVPRIRPYSRVGAGVHDWYGMLTESAVLAFQAGTRPGARGGGRASFLHLAVCSAMDGRCARTTLVLRTRRDGAADISACTITSSTRSGMIG